MKHAAILSSSSNREDLSAMEAQHRLGDKGWDGSMSGLLDAALSYSDRGFSVIPLIAQDKRPVIAWEDHQLRKAAADQITAWWAK